MGKVDRNSPQGHKRRGTRPDKFLWLQELTRGHNVFNLSVTLIQEATDHPSHNKDSGHHSSTNPQTEQHALFSLACLFLLFYYSFFLQW